MYEETLVIFNNIVSRFGLVLLYLMLIRVTLINMHHPKALERQRFDTQQTCSVMYLL